MFPRVLFCILLLAVFATAAPFRIGVLTDTAVERGIRFQNWAQLAVEDLASEVVLELVVNGTGQVVSRATATAQYQMQTAGVLGIVGPLGTAEGLPASYLAAAQKVPVFLPVSGSALSDKLTFSYSIRARPNDSDMAYPVIETVKVQGWTNIGIITEIGAYGAGFLSVMEQVNPPFQRNVVQFEAFPSTSMYRTMVEGLQRLLDNGLRIFVVHCSGAGTTPVSILRALNAVGILGNKKYEVLLTADISDNVATTGFEHPEKLLGTMGFLLSTPTTARFLAVVAQAKVRWGYNAFKYQDIMAYDAVIGYGRAIIALQQTGQAVTGANILNVLRNMTYEGLTGQIKYNANMERDGVYDLLNWQGTLQGTVIGAFNRATGFTRTNIPIFYPERTTEPVWDGFSVADKESLPVTQTAPLSALSFFVTTLSGWACLVLIEQSVYAVTKRKRHMLWTLLSAGLYGSCGVWGGIVINLGSASLGTQGHIALKTGPTIGLLFVSMVATFLSYLAGLKGVRRLEFPNEDKEKKGSKRKIYGTPETSITAASKQSVTAISSGKSSESIEEDEQARTAKAQFSGLRTKLNRWLLLAILIQVGAHIMVTSLLVESGIQPVFKAGLNAGYVVLVVVLLLLLFGLGLLFFFHFMPQTPSRGVAAIFLGLAVYLPSEVLVLGTKWTYHKAGAGADLSDFWDYESVALGLSIVTVLLCLALVAYNVFSMKLSRNSLDVHLAQFKRQFKLMTQQVDGYKEYINSLQTQKEELWKIIDLISISRPLARDHALAMALADFEKDHTSLQQLVQSQKDKQAEAAAQGMGLVRADVIANKPKHQEAAIMHCYEQIIKQQNNANREIRLEDILAHPVTLELLKDAMAKNMDAESLMLYLDIQRYKQLSNQKVRAFMAREIYDTFMARGAKYEVNVSDTLRKTFDARFAYDKGQLSPAAESALPIDLFSDLEREMRNLIQVNGMARLQSSGGLLLCSQLLAMLQATAARGASTANLSQGSRPLTPVRSGAVSPVSPSSAGGHKPPRSPSPPGSHGTPVARSTLVQSPSITTNFSRATGIAHVSRRPTPQFNGPAEDDQPPAATAAWASDKKSDDRKSDSAE